MKTAMQQLIEYLDPIHSAIKDKAIELLEVEKEQIVDAYETGYNNGYDNKGISGYQYLTQIYNNEKMQNL
jgi:hypothetical protein